MTKRVEAEKRGDFLEVKILDRICVESLLKEKEGFWSITTLIRSRTIWMIRAKEEMLSYFRRTVSEICENLQNGDDYRKVVDGIQDINTMITYLSQFMPLSAEERYELLKTDSLKERCLRFYGLSAETERIYRTEHSDQ